MRRHLADGQRMVEENIMLLELEVRLAGRGADLCIIDDPVSEQDALSPTSLDSIYEWYTSGPRQRLQPGGSIIIVMTRWGIKDLTAELYPNKLKEVQINGKSWSFLQYFQIQTMYWPEYWSREELDGVKRQFQ